MQLTDKLVRQIIETKYLATENTDRYRTILRYFYLQYEKLHYWLYQEDIYEQMKSFEYFRDYTIEQCQQDLSALVEWKNLVTIQDTRKVTSIEEFKNKKFRYQMSDYTVEIERMVLKLENLEIEGSSLEPTLLERIRMAIFNMEEMLKEDDETLFGWWRGLNDDFIRLNQNYQDYIRDLNSVKAEEMMKTREFLIFKDRLVDYLRNFVKSLQKNVNAIESCLSKIDWSCIEKIQKRVASYENAIPRLDSSLKEEDFLEKAKGRFESIKEWFLPTGNHPAEAEQLLDATNEIIRKITRYAAQISEQSNVGANRREEYKKVSQIFLSCKQIEQAHKLSALVFGVEQMIHLKGEFIRDSDSRNSGVYEESPLEVTVLPRITRYREKAHRSSITDSSKEKERCLKETLKIMERNRKRVEKLQKNGVIDFENLPEITPEVREILLNWISDALESPEWRAKTQDGEDYRIEMPDVSNKCVISCTDGKFTMPCMKIIFENLGVK